MPKRLRPDHPIYIAPQILGHLSPDGNPIIFDEKNEVYLDANNPENKITIYERQVNEWFLEPASNLVEAYEEEGKNNGFAILMICLSYLEGIEQYRQGQTSNGNSALFFQRAVQRLYPVLTPEETRGLYSEARCGLFHNGMVRGRIIINFEYELGLEFINNDIKINPRVFLNDIQDDFSTFIEELKSNEESRGRFSAMYSNL